MNQNGSRRSVLIAGGGQPSASTIAGNHDQFLHARTCQFAQLPRRRGGVDPPTSSQAPRGAQGRRLLGPTTLRTCPLASLLSQVRARLGPGGYCRRSGNGGPQTCLPAAYGMAQWGRSTAHLHQHKLKTLARGQASRGGRPRASSGSASSGWLARRWRDQGGVPHKVPVTQAMTTKGARR